MGTKDTLFDNTNETGAGDQGSDKSTRFENVKTIFADKIDKAAETLGEKAADQDAHSGLTQYGKQASEWLEKSANCIRQFDPNQANTKLREYVGQSPGRSLLIAGGVGLVIGAILRRR